MSIVGKFFFRCAKEFCQSGEVVEEAAPGFVLVRFDRTNDPTPDSALSMVALSVIAMKQDRKGEWDYEWMFFNTRAELKAHVNAYDGSEDDDSDEDDHSHTQGKMN